MQVGAMRFRLKRDANDLEAFTMLQLAGREPIRCTDFDIAAKHVDGFGILIEMKTKHGRMRPLQLQLAEIFGDRYRVCRSAEEALQACGIQTMGEKQ